MLKKVVETVGGGSPSDYVLELPNGQALTAKSLSQQLPKGDSASLVLKRVKNVSIFRRSEFPPPTEDAGLESSAGPLFGAYLSSLSSSSGDDAIPDVLLQMVEYLETKGLGVENIFRSGGYEGEQTVLKKTIDSGKLLADSAGLVLTWFANRRRIGREPSVLTSCDGWAVEAVPSRAP